MASPGKWEHLRPLRPDTLRVSEVHSGWGREALPVAGGRARSASLPERLRRFPEGTSLRWKDAAGPARAVHDGAL